MKSSIPATILMIVAAGMIIPTGASGVTFVWDGNTDNLFSEDTNWVGGSAPGTNKNVEKNNSITFNSGDSGDRIIVLDQGKGNPKVQPAGLLTINDTNNDSPSFTFNESIDDGFEYSLLGLDDGSGTIVGFDNNSTGAQIFNVSIGMQNSQVWESAGNITFNDTVFSTSLGENLTLSGSSGITFKFNESTDNAFENRTGNEVTLIQDFDGTVEMNGVLSHSSIDLKQGTFLLGGDNLIDGGPSTPANLTFSGDGTGTFSTDGYDATFNGSMTLSADGTIDFGSNGGSGGGTVLTFEDGGSRTTGTFTIDNWEGDIWSGGGTDQIIFGTTLSAEFLANVLWSDHTPAYQWGARQLQSGEILPLVPEPSTFTGIGFLVGLIFWREGKRRLAGNSDLS